MKYTKKERLDIGRRVYENELSRAKAAEEYGISECTARDYMRMYRDVNALPPKRALHQKTAEPAVRSAPGAVSRMQAMTKQQLIKELNKSRLRQAKIKNGCEPRDGRYGNAVRQKEYQVILELSEEYPITLLCDVMGVLRGSFYSWKKRSFAADRDEETR